jgi:homoserine dehydrogenase
LKKIKLGLIGFGTIGSGVVKEVIKFKELITRRNNVELEFKYICDLDTQTDRGVKIDKSILTSDWKKVVNDDEVDIIIELVGGVDFPSEIVSTAIKNGKHVVTANKALIAAKGEDLFKLAFDKKRYIGFEASVAGGIPIIRVIREALAGDRIEAIFGIINGTTNYILTKMIDEKMPFDEALKKAQELGFAEADPTLDINGGDAAAKISILASLAFNTCVEYSDVYMEGIENIDLKDVEYAVAMGYTIKLLAITKQDENSDIEVRVHPTLVPVKNSLASVKNEFNAVLMDSEFLGNSMYYGRGAGSLPTASAVVGDICSIASKISSGAEYGHVKYFEKSKSRVKDISELASRFYLRINTEDRSGVLAKVAGILADKNISIAEVHQKESSENIIPVVIVTHEAKEKDFADCIKKIDSLDFIKKKSVIFRLVE